MQHQIVSNRDLCGKLAFRAVGGLSLLLVCLCNPIVLRPRFWNTTVITRGIAVDALLILIGIGLTGLRKWAAVGLLAGALFLVAEGGLDPIGVGIFLGGSVLAVAFWPALGPGKRSDFLYALAAVLISVLMECLAFVFRRA